MKNFIYLLIFAILSMTLSSYTINSHNEKKAKGGDTILVKASVEVAQPIYQKGGDPLIKKATETMDRIAEQNDARLLLMQDALNSSTSKLQNIEYDLNTTRDYIFKKARADTMIKGISSILILILSVVGLIYIVRYNIKEKNYWHNVVIVTILFIITMYFLQYHLYYILSWIFNHQYLQIKELLQFIN